MRNSILLLLFTLSAFAQASFAQKSDSLRIPNNFSGAVTVTTKGISTVPNLTLGKPAVIFDLTLGKKEPHFRTTVQVCP